MLTGCSRSTEIAVVSDGKQPDLSFADRFRRLAWPAWYVTLCAVMPRRAFKVYPESAYLTPGRVTKVFSAVNTPVTAGYSLSGAAVSSIATSLYLPANFSLRDHVCQFYNNGQRRRGKTRTNRYHGASVIFVLFPLQHHGMIKHLLYRILPPAQVD